MEKKELIRWLKETRPEKLAKLFKQADCARKEQCGDAVHLRGIIEFSNHCRRDCLYCGLRKSNSKLERYRMPVAEIISTACAAKRLGIPTVVLQSGEDPAFGLEKIFRMVKAIKKMGLAVTLSLGELSRQEYRRLKDAGADRYLLKFETSDPRLYSQLRPGCRLRQRLVCLKNLRSLGYQVGSGIMAGLPGQSLESIAKDIELFKQLDLDMAGIGPFIPNPETPLAGSVTPDLGLALKAVALTRLFVPGIHLPGTTAAGTVDPLGREKALKGGGNVIMPNITPLKYRKLYRIYPNKICVNESAEDCLPCLRRRISSLGRTIARGKGDSLKPRLIPHRKG